MSVIAVSLGDPAGVGPEIVAKAWAARRALALPDFEAHGDGEALARAARACGADIAGLRVVSIPLAAREIPGAPDPRNGASVIAAIESAVNAAHSGRAGAIVTCPIAKSVLYEAGFKFPGHTEFIAELCGAAPEKGPLMMLAAADLRVALVTIHQPLREALSAITRGAIMRAATILDTALRQDFGVERPRIALAGLNPHAGEDGALGREEIEVINPAAAALRAAGIEISDARAPDSLFHADARRAYDAALCLYHDQGLIPIKTLDFWGGVNITLGLPVVRASPDHGTAFDIAGAGRASETSFVAALRAADAIAARRRALAAV